MRKLEPEAWFACERILQAHPEFQTYVEVKTDADLPYFFIRVPAPVPAHADLFIYTTEGELTLAFDRWHCHYNFEEVDSLVEKLDDILGEREIIVVKMKGSEWNGSTSLRMGEQLDGKFLSREGNIYWRSWNGTHDLGEYPPPKN